MDEAQYTQTQQQIVLHEDPAPYAALPPAQAYALRLLDEAGVQSYVGHGGGWRWVPVDVHLVATMVRPLGEFTTHPITGTEYDQPTALYSCVHLDGDGDCGIYDRRPAMCRDYPYGRRCEYSGCAWDYGRRLPSLEK